VVGPRAGGGSMDALVTADVFLFEGFRLDRRGLSRCDDQGCFVPVPIGSRALEILGVLVHRPGDLVSRDEIMNVVWPGVVVESSNLPVQIARSAAFWMTGERRAAASRRSRAAATASWLRSLGLKPPRCQFPGRATEPTDRSQ